MCSNVQLLLLYMIPFKIRHNLFDGFVVFIASMTLYTLTAAQGVGFGDELRFIIRIEEGFDFSTIATNHILYTNLLVLISKVFPNVDAFSLAVGFSAFFGALTLVVVHHIVQSQFENRWVSLATVFTLMLSFTFWRQSVTVEVYTFNLFVLSLFLMNSIKALQTNSNQSLFQASFILGISLWIHIQNILLIPALIYTGIQNRKLGYSVIPFAIFFLLLSACSFLYEGISGLHKMIYGNAEYLQKATNFKPISVLSGLLKGEVYFFFNFGLSSLVIVWGVYKLLVAWNQLTVFNLLFTLPTWLFSSNYSVPDNYVFFLPSYLALVVLSGIGYQDLYSFLSAKYKKLLLFVPLSIVLAYLFLPFVVLKFEKGRDIHLQKSYKGGVYYLTQPWMHNKPTLLPLVRHYLEIGILPPFYEDMSWTFDIAADYLDDKEQR